MSEAITYVGLEVHKASSSVAMLGGGSSKAVQWELPNETGEVRKLVRKLRREGGEELASAAAACSHFADWGAATEWPWGGRPAGLAASRLVPHRCQLLAPRGRTRWTEGCWS
jgi:hypothetical protein